VAASRYENIARSEKLANAQSQLDRKDAIEARGQAIKERDNSRRLSSSLTLEKGIALAQEGHADRGLLWMLEALKTAPEDAEEFRRMVRWNLGAWLGQVPKPLRIIGPGDPCDHLDFSPDGRSFATGYSPIDFSIATPINLWDTASGRKLASLPGMFAPFAFRPDGRVLIAYADAWRVVAIDLQTRQILWTSPRLAGQRGRAIGFSPDGSTVLASRIDLGRAARAWLLQLDSATGRERQEPVRGAGKMAVAPDGTAVATFHIEDGQAYIDVHELPSGRRTSTWPAGEPGVYDLSFGPDGKSLFGVVDEGDAFDKNSLFGQIWATGTGAPESPLMARTDGAFYVPSADRLLTRTETSLVLRDTATSRIRGTGVPADLMSEYALAFNPDGRSMLALCRDNTVRSWQVSAEAEPVSTVATDKPTSMKGKASNRQGRSAYASSSRLRSDGQIAALLARGVAQRELSQIMDPAAGRPIGRPAAHHAGWIIGSVAFSPDGRSFATGSYPNGRVAGEVRLWDTSTGRLLLPPMPHTNWVRPLAFRPDGKVLAAGDFNGLVRFWDTSSGRELGRPFPQGEIVLALAYSPDGKILAAGLSDDHTGKPGVRLWDAAIGRPIGELLPSPDRVHRIDFRPDGRALLVGAGSFSLEQSSGFTRLWDAVRAQAISESIQGEIAGGFHPNGGAFVTLASNGTVKLRDAMTGRALATLLTSSSGATCAAWRGDGGLIAVGFEDGTVRLCDPATNQPVGPPRSIGHAVRHVAFRGDGRSVAAIDELGESRTWPVPEPLEDSRESDLTLRVEARTGLRMDAGLSISRLGAAAWSERLQRLGQLDSGAVEPDTDPSWHEPMILEAEQNGNAFAANWHLDRLIALRPDDWFLYARRGRAWSLSGKLDKAAVDYQEAQRLGKREDVLDFQSQCVLDCTKAGRWAAALWYLDRLIAARPDDGLLHEDRAAVYGKLGREAERQAELARVFELGADEGLVVPRAEELGRAGRWAEAANLLARCGRNGPLSRELAQAWTIACLKAGNRAGYREACAAFMAHEGQDPTVVWNALTAASLLALAPEAIGDYRVLIAYIERRLSATPAPPALYRHLYSSALGGLLLRAGRTDEAIARLKEGAEVAKAIEIPTDWAYLGIAGARRRNFAEARRCLERLASVPPDSSATFWDLQEIGLLRSEADSLFLDAEFPGDPFQRQRPR
jgi:WD40 repeat protein/tetratricopeptide (TPR) repeat protein